MGVRALSHRETEANSGTCSLFAANWLQTKWHLCCGAMVHHQEEGMTDLLVRLFCHTHTCHLNAKNSQREREQKFLRTHTNTLTFSKPQTTQPNDGASLGPVSYHRRTINVLYISSTSFVFRRSSSVFCYNLKFIWLWLK